MRCKPFLLMALWPLAFNLHAREYLVKIKQNLSPMSKIIIRNNGGEIKKQLRVSQSYPFKILVLETQDEKLVNLLKYQRDVLHIEPNIIYSIPKLESRKNVKATRSNLQTTNVNDPLFDQLWGLNGDGETSPDIKALKAWELTKGSKDIVVAVIDTGIDYNHEDLKDNIWTNKAELNGVAGVDDDGNGFVDDIYGMDFANNDGDPFDDNEHGTHCAGTIGAVHNNATGVAGVMGDVKLMAVKFLTGAGSGSLSAAIESINYATDMGANVLSNSWGGGGYSQLLEDAIAHAKEKNVLFVAAAGNSSSNNDSSSYYPAGYQNTQSNVIAVAAHTVRDQLASFSSFGNKTVSLSAPGKDVVSTTPDNTYASFSGTSMATPHVSGAVGLLLAYTKSIGETLTNEQVRDRLAWSAHPTRTLRSKVVGGGRLEVYNLLKNIRPVRPWPLETEWVNYSLGKNSIESRHPYDNNEMASFVVTSPIATSKYMRLNFSKVDLESGYDFIEVRDANSGALIEKITGSGENVKSDYVEAQSVEIIFKSDASVNKWGFSLTDVQVIADK